MPRRGGWRRRGSKGRFRYEDARGNRITDPDRIERIEALVIPPAWKDVWISPNARAKLQATGIDAAGRRQYLYHPDFRAQQEQAKFDKLVRFAEKLPESARRDGPDMERDGLERERVAAVAVRLINLGWFRVGSERYVKRHRTFGITTLTKKHVTVRGSRIAFRFKGKHNVQIRTAIVDAELARTLRDLLELPGGRRLFRYECEGALLPLDGRKLNDYIREHMGEEFTAKDFRTWGGTLIAAIALAEHGVAETETAAKRAVAGVMRTRRRAAREHARGRTRVVRQPRGRRAVLRRENDRGFPAPAFACCQRAGYRSRPRGAGAPRPAALVAYSPCAQGRVISLAFR